MGERLKGRVALITGIGSAGPGWGNGKAIATLFAREGASIFGCDLRIVAAEEAREIIISEGGSCTIWQVDVSHGDQVEEMVQACMDVYGTVDILVNNVGIIEVGGPVELSEECWDQIMAVNVKSVFLTCKYCLPIMEKNEHGAIVNVSSIAALRFTGYPSCAYNASKGAVNQLTKNVAIQYAAKGIRANCVLPGLMNTPMIQEPLKRTYADGDIHKMIDIRNQQCPTGKMGDAWDVAHAALFLASDESNYINGANIVVDGGLINKFA
jgi:NAD(P)-dependent dehydrogenase (short-subunit alcohol dehydrogenase family)